MSFRPSIRLYLDCFGYAAAILLLLREPPLLAASVLQLTVCGGGLALLLLLVAYHKELRALVHAAFRLYARILLWLLPASYRCPRHTADLFLPSDPFYLALFQRPPPHFALS